MTDMQGNFPNKCHQKFALSKARPEPDFGYFSKAAALVSSANAW